MKIEPGKTLLFLLTPLEWLFRFIVRCRVKLYQKGFFKSYSFSTPIISIGNLTLGGTGKTPLVESLAREAIEQGKKVAILSRGYKRLRQGREKDPQRVQPDPKRSLREQAQQWGDEPLMLALRLPEAVVLVGVDRVQAAQKAIKHYKVDLILLDDGFQHLRLNRHLNLLVVDAIKGFGNGRVLPRGMLREPLSSIKRADAIVLSKVEGEVSPNLLQQIKFYHPSAPLLKSSYQAEAFIEVGSQKRFSVDSFKGKPVFLFSGLGSPESFESTCTSLGIDIVGKKHFPDHHYFSLQDTRMIVQEAKRKKASVLITTEKDVMRLPENFLECEKMFFLKILSHSSDLKKWLKTQSIVI